MAFQVRTSDGELIFPSTDELWQAGRVGTVSIEDQVLAPGATQWCPVAELPGDPRSGRSLADYHWYILAAAIVLMVVFLGVGWVTGLMALAAVSTHSVWMSMHRKGQRR